MMSATDSYQCDFAIGLGLDKLLPTIIEMLEHPGDYSMGVCAFLGLEELAEMEIVDGLVDGLAEYNITSLT
jgi:hypothetical protein